MSKMIENLKKNRIGYLWILSALFALVFPLIFKLIGLSTLIKIVILFVGYGIFALYLGLYIRKLGLKIFNLLVFPVFFAVVILVFSLIKYGLFSFAYAIYFPLYFIILSFFTYQTNESLFEYDIDKQIPVDGGIKGLKNNGKK